MKHQLLVIGLIISSFSYSQINYDSSKNELTYSEVIQLPNKNSNEIYLSIYEWFAKTYNSANSVIQLNDKENGKIIGKGGFTINCIYEYGNIKTPQTLFINYTQTVQIKDGRFKYEFSNINVKASQNTSTFGIEMYYNVDKKKLVEETSKSIKNEKMIEKLADGTFKFHKEIFNQTDKSIFSIINSLKSFLLEKKKEDW